MTQVYQLVCHLYTMNRENQLSKSHFVSRFSANLLLYFCELRVRGIGSQLYDQCVRCWINSWFRSIVLHFSLIVVPQIVITEAVQIRSANRF